LEMVVFKKIKIKNNIMNKMNFNNWCRYNINHFKFNILKRKNLLWTRTNFKNEKAV
jgi:hypothetical protein